MSRLVEILFTQRTIVNAMNYMQLTHNIHQINTEVAQRVITISTM